jgi:malate dehydrogenase (oxaloacetate-decarboxylating)(NADP+)
LVELGLKKDNIIVTDHKGVVYEGREEGMDVYKARYAVTTEARVLSEALPEADIFLGLSIGNVLKPEWLAAMAKQPLLFPLANPIPEIMPEVAKEARPDAIIATGRSDYPNQVNNVLCFPFLFRGALDVGATEINSAMKTACVHAIAELTLTEPARGSEQAGGVAIPKFGPDYLIPSPFDPRLVEVVPMAVAQAAMESGAAQRPIQDMQAYQKRLHQFGQKG